MQVHVHVREKKCCLFYQSQRNLVEMSHLEEAAHEGFVYKVMFLKIFDLMIFNFICRPTEMILELEDPDGGKEKLGQICVVITVQPKNFEDRQEVI